ncbi:hypothetical protein NDU88_005489 [Pleurodeles waltl]|uniref:Uncharacterized protein n=1 Tax=Pleurodeles waltl TaxID=8319 RepID=A0AAV7MAM6_PLEWA|nr:hypothetical protein NDU88_005489 [Pleurodeles waltl]
MGKYATAWISGEGECPGAVLAGIASPSREKDTILAIEDVDGSIIIDQERIINRFCDYYTALNTTKITLDLDATSDYLMHVAMPWLTNADTLRGRQGFDRDGPENGKRTLKTALREKQKSRRDLKRKGLVADQLESHQTQPEENSTANNKGAQEIWSEEW